MRRRIRYTSSYRLNSARRGHKKLNCASGVVRLPDGSVANLSSRSYEDALYDIIAICREYVNDDFADYVEEYCNDLNNDAGGAGEAIADKIAKSAANDILEYRNLIDEFEIYINNHDIDKADYEFLSNYIQNVQKRCKSDYEYENWAETFADSNLNSSYSNTRPIEEFVHDFFRSDSDNPAYADFENICYLFEKYAGKYLTDDCFEDEAEMVRVMRRIPYDVRAMIMSKADKYLISDDIYIS